MRHLTLFFFIFVVIGCTNNEEVVLASWYISVSDDKIASFSVLDTLEKFSKENNQEKLNNPQFWSYRSDLHYMTGDTVQAKISLTKSYEMDSVRFCNNYVKPIYEYLTQSNPERKGSIPGIIQKTPEHFIDLALKCDCHKFVDNVKNQPEEVIKDYLRIRWVSLFDQWYRVPLREMDIEMQSFFDQSNEEYLTKNFINKDISTIPTARSIFFVVILHSYNCDWVLRWIKKYFYEYKNEKHMKNNLEHFLYRRSDCRHDENIRDTVEEMIKHYP